MNFSREEMIDMIYALEAGERNSVLASRIYGSQFPDRRHPKPAAFAKLKERFERTGTVSYEVKHRVQNEETEFAIIGSVVEDPHSSTRQIGQQLSLSQSTVSRVLRRNKFHPYHVQLLQGLNQNDFARRQQFCQWALNKQRQQNGFFDCVLFTDEATFHNNGQVNRHNLHYYYTANPHFTRPVDNQHKWSLNV